jgi:1-acyl-sn-glycerol-3-phosphate acyltransferase
VHGLEHVAAGESYVVMSNHQSHYDIPVVFCALPMLSIRMVAKASLFRVPIWGRALRVSGFVPVDRSRRERAIASLRAARETMQSGISVWIAPEGTRSRTGELGELKHGGFHLALDTGVRILPVTIDGTRDVLPANGYAVRRGVRVRVTVHPPIDPREHGPERRAELVDRVRAAIAGSLSPPGARAAT